MLYNYSRALGCPCACTSATCLQLFAWSLSREGPPLAVHEQGEHSQKADKPSAETPSQTDHEIETYPSLEDSKRSLGILSQKRITNLQNEKLLEYLLSSKANCNPTYILLPEILASPQNAASNFWDSARNSTFGQGLGMMRFSCHFRNVQATAKFGQT